MKQYRRGDVVGQVAHDSEAITLIEFTEIEAQGIDTRTVWSGNITRHPMMAGVEHRVPDEGLPEADAVFERGMTLGMSHGLSDEEVTRVTGAIHAFAAKWR